MQKIGENTNPTMQQQKLERFLSTHSAKIAPKTKVNPDNKVLRKYKAQEVDPLATKISN